MPLRRSLAHFAFVLAHVTGLSITHAQEPTNSTAEESETDRKARAVIRFDRGRDLYTQKAWSAALAEFQEAGKIYPTWSARAWSAQCLKNLARFDEAFDMYAALVNDYGDKLPADAKKRALVEVESMRNLVGNIEIEGAVPGAAIFVDRQSRGEYPLLAPLRVSAGSHLVKVFVEGYEPFETQIDVAGATTARVRAILRKLDSTGILRVVEQQERSLDVVVDGIVVGKTPLSLRIAPGEHIVFLRGDANLGTLPARVNVQGDNDAPIRLVAESLESELQVNLEPFDALIAVDSVTLGKGAWNGRVKPGSHTIEVAAEGFLSEKRQIEIAKDGKQVVSVVLTRDAKSPFWRRPDPPPHWFVEGQLGVPLVTTIGGDVAGSCTDSCSELPGFGFNLRALAGYELGSGFSFGGTVGVLQFLQSIEDRTVAAQVVGSNSNSGTAADELRFRGSSVGLFAGYSFGEKVRVHLRLGAGLAIGSFADIRTASLTTNDGTPYAVGPLEQFKSVQFFYVTPEVRVNYRIRERLALTVGLEMPLYSPLTTPTWNAAQGFTAGKDGFAFFTKSELTGSPFVALVPSFGVHYDFR